MSELIGLSYSVTQHFTELKVNRSRSHASRGNAGICRSAALIGTRSVQDLSSHAERGNEWK